MSQGAKTSCDGCAHYLGGGLCAINVEGECREGGGYELYDWQEKAQSKQGGTYDSERHIFLLLQMERKAHAETRRRLERPTTTARGMQGASGLWTAGMRYCAPNTTL